MSSRKKVTIHALAAKRRGGRPITMVTAYDYPSARVADAAGIDAILVGDSLAMTVLGHDTTLSVTMDEMLHHARAVRRGAERALLIGDLPFMSYQADSSDAVRNAGRFLQEAGMNAVKLEGGRRVEDRVRAIVEAGIPVMGHLGLTPQSVHALGGWRVQGKSVESARELVRDARLLEAAGCFAMVLEGVPARLGSLITRGLGVPTIGIGAGSGTSGQVLVYNDIVGLYDGLAPRFVKRFAELGVEARRALEAFREEVDSEEFPAEEHSYAMPENVWNELLDGLEAEAISQPDAPRAVGQTSDG